MATLPEFPVPLDRFCIGYGRMHMAQGVEVFRNYLRGNGK